VEGKGRERKWIWKGKDGKERTPPCPRPLLGGGGAAAPQKGNGGNGQGQVVEEKNADSPTLNFVDSLSQPKRDALRHAVEKFNSKAWSKERVNQHLCVAEFEDQELRKSEYLFASPEATR
jgi:hypothetical protein